MRWFILSDSPPEKDVQWSDTGVSAANKFLQRIWNLNFQIKTRSEKKKIDKNTVKKFVSGINSLSSKIDSSIDLFKFNVAVAHFYEMYNFFKIHMDSEIDNQTLKENSIKMMKLMMPFTPHLSHECLEFFGHKEFNTWPKLDTKSILNEISLAVQINGKTRDVIRIKKDLDKESINQIINKDSKAKKYLENNKVIKTIFVKNKIVNYIIKQ